MSPRAIAALAAGALAMVLALSIPASADWVQLSDGTRLRGVDLEGRGEFRRFTLENGIRVRIPAEKIVSVEKSPPGETVEHGGRQVALREKIRILRAEEAARERKAIRDLEAWARGSKRAEEARRAFEALPPADRERYLSKALLKSSSAKARGLAVSVLAEAKDPKHVPVLAGAAVEDASPGVRSKAAEAIEKIGAPDTADAFVPYLRSASPAARVRAAGALEVFPSERAVPHLIDRLHKVWSGFGRAHFFQGVERAYITDYNLVSGGTGYSLIEVADPEVGVSKTGVVLDVRVVRVEAIAYARALERTTGQRFGVDPARWAAWWREREASDRK